ncbi:MULTISPECIES: hypothetical protein [Mycolicibacterium]|jgi:predicted small secreted protein|uniref:Uncharacterized protein n=2 Tax=Mycolicibacterium TaxID=1866885 RepID=A0A7I7VW91_9MYCO|nr:hypothetical protein MDOR_19370 [Mycolicibacterium doricum]BBZ60688.1 hypothetical protein MMON_19890 [Mycolicibacterium monacense]
MRSAKQSLAVVAALVIAAAQVTGCTTGEDAVAQGGTFDFVSPGTLPAASVVGPLDLGHDPPPIIHG